MDTINRLQFRHHNEIFETREDAIKYIYDEIKEKGEGIASGQNSVYSYSLFAEPTILRYKNDEEETGCDFKKGPHIMLVIGSETNDTIYHDRNKFCIIDIDKTEEEIKNLEEELAKAVKSLTLAVFDTSTLDLHVEKTDDGTFLSGDVKTADTHVFEDIVKDNNLMVVPVGDEGGPEGLFIYVDLTYDEMAETFTFVVSQSDGTLKKTSVKLPNNYLVSGEYKRQDESLHLKMRNGDDVVVNCEELIAEWGVEGDASKTPIVLTREEVDYDNTDEHHHVEPWQDVLRADVRLANDRPANILKKTTDGRYLYVDGVASNILYYWNGERSNVEEQLNKLNKIRISPDNDNIIWNRADGFFASTKLDYNSNDNKLIFTTSTVNGQPFVKEIQLNTVEVIESITYDPTREVLVVKYKNDKGETKTIYVPVSGLIDEWEVLNDAHSVKLVKQRKISGKDILTADVNISIVDDNILEERGEGNIHALFVRGTADNIKYKDTTVEGALDALAAEDEAINERLDEEIARAEAAEQILDAKIDQEIADRTADVDEEETRAKAAEQALDAKIDQEIADRTADVDAEESRAITEEQRIDTTIGSGFTTDAHETVTYKFEQLQNQVNSEAEKLQNEIDRSTEKDEEHDSRLDEQQAEIEAVSADSKASLKDIINNDHSINVDKTDPVRPVIKVNLSTEVEDERKNIIKLNNDGLFSNVDLSYIKDSNKLIFHTSNDEPDKEIQLESVSSIISIEYNPTKEAIVIKYMTNGHEIKTVEIPVGDLINEWRVEDGHPNAVELKKDRVASGTSEQDILRAKVIITEEHDDNILKMDDGALYVPGYDDDIADIYAKIDAVSGDVISEIARAEEAEQVLDEKVENEMARAQNAETALQNAINTEESRAISAETALGTKIDQEIADRTADVDAEEVRAKTEEQRIDSTIGSGFTTDAHETVTYKFEQLQNQVNSEANKLQNEIDRSTEKDNEHDSRLDKQQVEIETISADSANSLKSISSNDSIKVDNTDNVNPVISVNLSNKSGNTINLVTQEGSEGLYSTVDISYDSLVNELTLTKSTSVEGETTSTTVKLNNGISIIERIEYDSATEEIVIYYKTTSGEEESIRIPVSHIISEWTTGETNTVLLDKERVVSGGPDILTANVKVCHDEHHQDNAIEVHQNGLYVHSYSREISDLSSRIDTVSGDVINEIARAEAAEQVLDAKINQEITDRIADVNAEEARAISAETALGTKINQEIADRIADVNAEETRALTAEQVLENKIGSGFTDNSHENVTYKFEQLQNQVNSEANKLQNEIDRSTEKDNEHDNRLNEQQTEIEAISADSVNSLKDITCSNGSINIDKTNPTKPNINVSICHHEDNAIEEHNDGLYVHSYSGEISDLSSRIDTVSGDVITEKTRAEEAENNLDNSITTERDRAIAAENGLHDEIEAERRRAESADTALSNAIADERRRAMSAEETLANSIGDEVIRATNAEENLSHLINDEAERRISGDSILRNDINNEIIRSTNKDNEHDTAISNLEASAHSLSDKILQEAVDRDVADASLRELINTEKSDRIAQDTVITERLANEINRSTAEDDRLNAALQQEINDRTSGDAELEQAIRDATLTFKNTITAKMNKSAANEVTTDVIVPTDDNIIIVDEGIKAMVKLSYDAATNKLMLEKTTASGHTWDTVQLNAGSIIQSIDYDSHTKELVIKYEKTSEPGVQYETRVNVEDLFNPWLPNNLPEKSAIELGLILGAGPLGEDLLSARTLITDDSNGDGKPDEGSDNMIEIRNNGLYVSNSSAIIAGCVSGKTDAMYKAIFGTSMPSGCGEGIKYVPDSHSCILSAATSFADADSIMSYEICKLSNMLDSGLTCTAFVDFVDNPITDKKDLKVNLRSSHGKGNIMTDDDIYITDCDAKIIEPGVSEFTDTNALRIVCLENCGGTLPDLKDNQNGIYLSNVWNCGKYYQESTEADEMAEVEADGYNVNYFTDETEGGETADYSNYLRC